MDISTREFLKEIKKKFMRPYHELSIGSLYDISHDKGDEILCFLKNDDLNVYNIKKINDACFIKAEFFYGSCVCYKFLSHGMIIKVILNPLMMYQRCLKDCKCLPTFIPDETEPITFKRVC